MFIFIQIPVILFHLFCTGQQETSTSCVAASVPPTCCFFGVPDSCVLSSGCACDRACYDRGDCCDDIADTGCAGEHEVSRCMS